MTPTAAPTSPARQGEPAWQIAELFPPQGLWSEEEYLALNTNRLVEFDDGNIEVLPLPTKIHQLIMLFLRDCLIAFLEGRGSVLVSPYRLKIPNRKFREPDVIYLTPEQDTAAGDDFFELAEILMEVVSPDDPDRDYVKKRADYAAAHIPEYWIIDPAAQLVTVLRLESGRYVEHGRFGPRQQATSVALPGFAVNVDDVLSQGR